MIDYQLGPTLLNIEHVSKEYDGRLVLRDVNVEVKDIEGIDRVLGQVVAILGLSGAGKCLGENTPILMFDGSIRAVQHIVPGDLLMGPDSLPRRVMGINDGVGHLFRVVPVKGDSFVVNQAHVLAFYLTGASQPWREMSVEEFVCLPESWRNRAKLYRTGVDFREQSVSIDPYFLGIWLGDGHSSSSTITNPDQEIHEAVAAYAVARGEESRVMLYSGSSCPTLRLSAGWQRDVSTTSALRRMGLLWNKHVPVAYKNNSREVRLQVLAGLLDSDGSLSNNCFDFISKYRALAEDVCYLARSLGLAAYLRPCQKRCQNGGGGEYFRVSISGDTDLIPTRVLRKVATPRKQKKSVLRTGFKIEPMSDGRFYGFQLDGDGLFLLGDFTVTHNSTLFRIMAGLEPPTSGRVVIHNGTVILNEAGREARAGDVGVVAQNYPLFRHRSVFSNLMVAAMQHGLDRQAAEEKVRASLAEFNLTEQSVLYPAQLSGGQRQRAAILQQVLCSEHFILMDEPFSGLDIKMIDKTLELIESVANRDTLNTLVLVTHDITSALAVADFVWVLGHEVDARGEKIAGARILKQYDLISQGFEWRPGITTEPEFMNLVREVKEDFRKL